MDRTIIRRAAFRFTKEEKHQIIQDLLTSGWTKQEIWKKYTGQDQEHGKILNWMRKFGYNTQISGLSLNFRSNTESMAQKKIKKGNDPVGSDESFEQLQLKRRIVALEKQLKDSELKAIAFSTMIDIAEKEYKIPIRKKFNTKPSKR